LSEKMDGVRSYWDGDRIWSRHGNEFPAPPYFTEKLGKFPLDGELWLGRNTFEKLIGILKSKDADWSQVKYIVFDLPGSKKIYEGRMELLKKIPLPPHAKPVKVEQCRGKEHLEEIMKGVTDLQGEGLIANKAMSLYVPGRTTTLLKVKKWDDAEVRLVEVLPTGLRCEQPNGMQVTVQAFQQIIQDPPKIGSILTVKCNGYYNNGRLKHPYFYRERHELTWDDVKNAFENLKPPSPASKIDDDE